MRDYPGTHWLFEQGHVEFRHLFDSIVREAGADLTRPDVRTALGYEDTQCQHFFSTLFTMLRERRPELTVALQCCQTFPDAFIEVAYFRSVARRVQSIATPQLVERETGADFAITLEVDVPDSIHADPSVLGQAKLIDGTSVPIAGRQLQSLLATAGAESAAYLMWGPNEEPRVMTAQNIDTLARIEQTNSLSTRVLRYGRPFGEFLLDSFIALWFGRDFDRNAATDIPPSSPGALY